MIRNFAGFPPTGAPRESHGPPSSVLSSGTGRVQWGVRPHQQGGQDQNEGHVG